MTDVTKNDEPTKEEVKEESDDEEVPALEAAEPGAEEPNLAGRTTTRSEKKSRKAMAKMGLKPFPGVTRVTMKRSKTISFVITNPDVFVSKNTYVIFGEAKIDEPIGKEQELLKAFQAAKQSMEKPADAPVEAEDEEEEVDEEGVSQKDIDIVLSQVSVSRAKAVKALKANNNDIVNTIMALNA
eukprot:TRINITY_DN43928_c0_g1_i1.p2 TRINITY_DN43928_c0_g1~~TRINITY_DN43928_c0_g1_i1.p2  ORF type:complete len:184 (+),score=99.17 TRINITY_DN43928_c0_g1_i1:75-626(+)